ncbi:rust resistance kinase Lr10-like [Syzygium oleosum]|uniref:rust resistance kinase Lr10-like n=1 Tax=Syzygium oleosum TaxID=219896 RepID=UPI0024B9F5AB|nr:rust resistance kinase Lr10-like [Syzygium oleosum]
MVVVVMVLMRRLGLGLGLGLWLLEMLGPRNANGAGVGTGAVASGNAGAGNANGVGDGAGVEAGVGAGAVENANTNQGNANGATANVMNQTTTDARNHVNDLEAVELVEIEDEDGENEDFDVAAVEVENEDGENEILENEDVGPGQMNLSSFLVLIWSFGKDILKRVAFCELQAATNHFSDKKIVARGRKKIALGAARAISHLHNHGVIHGDIKPHNILLDENFEARIGDFGKAIFMDKDEEKGVSKEASLFSLSFVSTQIGRTYGYLDPEYSKSGMCSVKSNVYGFGVTLLELISSRCAQRRISSPGLLLPEWAGVLFKDEKSERLVDADIRSGHKEGEVKKTILLALICTQLDPRKQPNMVEVVQILEGAISSEKRGEESENDSIMPTRQWLPKL